MCGICGVYSFKSGTDGSIPARLREMTRTLVHRGPDDDGYHVEGRVALGHRRLSIIDLATGKQPLFNEDGSVSVIANGEIYNFRDIRNQLEGKGHVFRTNSDIEVIPHLYEERGADFVLGLRGMFAIALWDRKKQLLILARDRIGIKPVYYAHLREHLVFGSEMKAILASGLVGDGAEMDSEALIDFLTYQCIPAPKTIFKRVRKLEPGHILLCRPGGVRSACYWKLTRKPVEPLSEKAAREALLAKLEEAVGIRLISDVPLGAFLSGGIDSSTVVALMSRITGRAVECTAVGFEHEKLSELEYAREAARHFGAEYHEYVVKPAALDIVEKLVFHFDEPFADASMVPTYYVSQVTRNHVTVALSGDGGDESFAGYRRYYFDLLENRLRRRIPKLLRKTLLGGLAAVYPKGDYLPRVLRAKTLLENLSRDPLEGYFGTRSTFGRSMLGNALSKGLLQESGGYDPAVVMADHFRAAGGEDPLWRIQYVDFQTYLPDDILTKVDRMSMAVSLETRVPLLDHELVEFVASLPSGLKLKGRTGKYILKESVRGIIPERIVDRTKMGFVLPISDWFREESGDKLRELVLGSRARARGLFDFQFVERMWKLHRKRVRELAPQLWALVVLELWHRMYVDGAEWRKFVPEREQGPQG